MKKDQIRLGGVYAAKVSGGMTKVKILRESSYGGWDAKNLNTDREVRIKSAQRLRYEVKESRSTLSAPCPSCGKRVVLFDGKPREGARHAIVDGKIECLGWVGSSLGALGSSLLAREAVASVALDDDHGPYHTCYEGHCSPAPVPTAPMSSDLGPLAGTPGYGMTARGSGGPEPEKLDEDAKLAKMFRDNRRSLLLAAYVALRSLDDAEILLVKQMLKTVREDTATRDAVMEPLLRDYHDRLLMSYRETRAKEAAK